MSEPIINQPWEDVANDVTGAIEKAVQPLLKAAVDSIYSGLLDTTQDYLRDNLAFNIASRIDTADREAASARERVRLLEEGNSLLLAALTRFIAEADLGHVTIETDRNARAAIARATGEPA